MKKRSRSSSRSCSRERSKSSTKRRRSKSKNKKRNQRKDHKRRRSSSSSSTSSSSSSSSSNSSSSRERRRKEKKRKKRKKKRKKKKEKTPKKSSVTAVTDIGPMQSLGPMPGPSTEDGEQSKSRSMRPMTKEEWEKSQSVIRHVYDPETGRTRLVKGDGEILEEIVSKQRQKEINKQATKGDGLYFATKMGIQDR